jgi:arylformamidase
MDIIDLSLPLTDGMPHFPGSPPMFIGEHQHFEEHGCRTSVVVMGNHAGTHLDAPSHFVADGRTVGELDLQRCVGEALVLDLSEKAPREAITAADLKSRTKGIALGARLLIRTGWDRTFGQPEYFTDYPPLASDAAEWVAQAGVALLGLDLPSVHPSDFALIHQVLLSADVVIVESLANLDKIPTPRVLLIAAPLKLAALDGAPIRALALGGERE